jgi:hypothetical protein
MPGLRSLGIAAALVVSASGCGDSGGGGGKLQIHFPVMYSAYDGTHTFQIPATVGGVSGVTWSASDMSMVDIEAAPDGGDVMITIKKAGMVTIRATAGGLAGEAPLTITQFTPAQWDSGSSRYNNGISLSDLHMNPALAPERKMLACTNCHGASGMDIEHTPMQTGGYSDQDLVTIFTMGQKPPGVPQRIMPYDMWHRIHQWVMTDEEKTGLVVYLRALTPTPQGPVDFGGHGMWGGGMGWWHRDGGGPGGGGPDGGATP